MCNFKNALNFFLQYYPWITNIYIMIYTKPLPKTNKQRKEYEEKERKNKRNGEPPIFLFTPNKYADLTPPRPNTLVMIELPVFRLLP
jgi:hypothetical protein